ncbi:hypothetical protein [Aquimarina macrocephali]|uniref:hypothetical protein n=1 Tax=Aquimarina macrocephali TaxID=666563 RepID=UPI003F67832C
MNYLKENPVGIDIQIQRLQIKLYESLRFEGIDGYGRVYLEDKKGKRKPLYFINGNEYKEVLINDSTSGTFFFIEDEKSKIELPKSVTEVDIIFLLDLKKIKPTITHRADEEVRVDILKVLNRCRYFEVEEITKGIKALSDFDTKLIDMQPYHFIKINGKLRYQFNC